MSHVLCAHGSDAFLAELRRELEERGLQVKVARTLGEAVAQISRVRPDLVVGGLPPSEERSLLALARAGGVTSPSLLVSDDRSFEADASVAAILPRDASCAQVADKVVELLSGAAFPAGDGLSAIGRARSEFAAEAASRVRQLLDAIAALLRAPSPDAFAAARDVAHRLCGTAGSYGYHDVSRVAGRVEDVVERADASAEALAALARLAGELEALHGRLIARRS